MISAIPVILLYYVMSRTTILCVCAWLHVLQVGLYGRQVVILEAGHRARGRRSERALPANSIATGTACVNTPQDTACRAAKIIFRNIIILKNPNMGPSKNPEMSWNIYCYIKVMTYTYPIKGMNILIHDTEWEILVTSTGVMVYCSSTGQEAATCAISVRNSAVACARAVLAGWWENPHTFVNHAFCTKRS